MLRSIKARSLVRANITPIPRMTLSFRSFTFHGHKGKGEASLARNTAAYHGYSKSTLVPQLRYQSTAVSPAAATIPDPERLDLYYHLFEPPHQLSTQNAVFALSFLSEPPLSVFSRTVIGWLPALPEGTQAGLNDFTENGKHRYELYFSLRLLKALITPAAFVELLHNAVKTGLTDGVDDIQKNAAIQFQEGWMHIHGKVWSGANLKLSGLSDILDERNPPPLGRIGDPDDIIGSVRVENGQVGYSCYQRFPALRTSR